jgi:3-hydroxybutyryl-CoA dehydrogenase
VDVVVIGAGLMGSQIGCEYALAGHRVTFLLRDVDRGRTRVVAAFDVARGAGIATQEQSDRSDVRFVTDVEALDPSTELVVESIPEDIEVKSVVFRRVAAHVPDAILASNTSSIPLTELGDAIGAPERVVGTHYWNPPLLMPPVEIIAGEQTRPEVVTRVWATLESLGKEPVLVERDVPGFIWNRLQFALLREVLWLVDNGVASPETIDRVVRSGLARRLRHTGPFDTIALGGAHSWARVAETLFPLLSSATEPPDLERWLDQDPAHLDAVRARRDRGLAAELRRSGEVEA